jgi:hypothetical protein
MNLAPNLTRATALRQEGPTLVCGENRMPYAQLDICSAGVAPRRCAFGLRSDLRS